MKVDFKEGNSKISVDIQLERWEATDLQRALVCVRDNKELSITEKLTTSALLILLEHGFDSVEESSLEKRTILETINNVELPTNEDAERIVTTMRNIIERFGYVSLHDFFELVGIPSTFKNNRVGWTKLDDVGFVKSRRGWRIDFPPMVQL